MHKNLLICDGHGGELADGDLVFEVKVEPKGWAAKNGGAKQESMPAELDLCQRCFSDFAAAFRQLREQNSGGAAIQPLGATPAKPAEPQTLATLGG